MSDLENQVTEADLHDEDVVEEAHDPKNAEDASVASVKGAAGKTAKAPEPAPKQGVNMPMPKTKAGMLQAMYASASKMNKAQLTAAYGKMHDDVEVDDDAAIMETPNVSYDYAGELDALVESEATLSEEFKEKTTIIFESAMKAKLAEEIESLEETYANELAEEIATTKSDLVEKVDSYLNYVVEQWMEDNKVAVESGLRTEIAEKFMTSLKDLFTESYIEVPESKVDLVDELAAEVEELEEAHNTAVAQTLAMQEELEVLKRDAIIREAAEGLAAT